MESVASENHSHTNHNSNTGNTSNGTERPRKERKKRNTATTSEPSPNEVESASEETPNPNTDENLNYRCKIPGTTKRTERKKRTSRTVKNTDIKEVEGGKPNGKELNPLVLKIKPLSGPLYKKLASVKAEMQGNITKDMIVKEAQNMLGDLLSQDQLGLIKEELDV